MTKSKSSPPRSIGINLQAASFEPARAERCFNVLRPRLVALPRDRVRPVNVDPQAAAVVVFGVCEIIRQPALRVRFEKLVSIGELPAGDFHGLEDVAQCTWYARHQYLLTSAQRSEARIPTALSQKAYGHRARMLKLAEYYFDDHAVEGPRLVAIRDGSGYLDLANDLVALADLCQRRHSVVVHDRKYYRADDIAVARGLAEQILQQLGLSASVDEQNWSDLQARAFTLMVDTYEQVARAGRFLLHFDDGETRFPSLITAARATASTPPSTPPASSPPPATP